MKKFLKVLMLVLLITSSIIIFNNYAYADNVNESKAITNISKTIKKRGSSINIKQYGVKVSEISDVIQRVRENIPVYIDANRIVNMSYAYDENTQIVEEIYIGYTLSKEQYENRLNYINKEIKKIIRKTVKKNMTDYAKALIVHDYIIDNSTYKFAEADKNKLMLDDYTIYGLLINKAGVCEAYSRLYKAIMNEIGIECENVRSIQINHQWNIIKINKKWYHVDVTWDDPIVKNGKETILHDLFMLTEKESQKMHKTKKWTAIHKATSTKFKSFPFKDVQGKIIYSKGRLIGNNGYTKIIQRDKPILLKNNKKVVFSVKKTETENATTLKWNKSKYVTRYVIYRKKSDGGKNKKYKTTKEGKMIIPKDEKSYYYMIKIEAGKKKYYLKKI